ncbi:uncharacterized protein LOC135332146 [Halichondria panicea]|uniref:uncharacterized protein LOC135332146 n=1 Tax=Halichondria panicea TaxID=6063 RepID=UPI00312BA880
MQHLTALVLLHLLLLPLVYAQTTGSGSLDVSIEAWIAVGIVAVGFTGIILINWVVFFWRICRICSDHKAEERNFKIRLSRRLEREERYRRQPHVSDTELRAVALRRTNNHQVSSPNQPRSSQTRQEPIPSTTLAGMARTNAYQQRGPSTANGIPRSTSNGSSITVASTSSNIGIRRTSSNSSSQLGMVRLSYNSNEIGALQSSRSTSRGNGIDHVPNTMPNSLQPYRCAPGQIQPAGPRVMIGSANYRVQLQSLSEVEEMDVRPEASEGPPKYSQLFPEMEEQQGAQSQRDKSTSPFTFNRPGRTQEFNQLSSWPNFKL